MQFRWNPQIKCSRIFFIWIETFLFAHFKKHV
jgi:hypothetical protein